MQTRTTLVVLAASVAALGLGGCGGEEKKEPASAGPALKTIEIVETDFKLSPATVKVDKAGTYTFRAVNRGKVEHSLEVEGEGVETKLEENLAPGASGELTVTLEAGTYELYCPVGNHKDQGMEGTLAVGAEAASTPAKTDEDSGDSGYGYGR